MNKRLSPKAFLTIVILFCSTAMFAQNVGINSTGQAPDASAGLDISFTDKGLLIPQVPLTSTTDISTIVSPATSLLVYNTATSGDAPNNVVPGYYYYNGSIWVKLSVSSSSSEWTISGSNLVYSTGNIGIGTADPLYKLHINSAGNPLFLGGVQEGSASDSLLTISNGVVKKLSQSVLSNSGWSLTGNTTTSTNFLGTLNNESVKIRTNNQQRLVIDSLGSIGIGPSPVFSADREKVLIDLGGSQDTPLDVSSYNALNIKGYLNNYLQLNIQNKYSGAEASSDLIATANNGSETTNFVDLGINNQGNTKNYFGGVNDAYLFNVGQDFLIGTGSNKNLQFLTGGGNESINERMRITGSGFVGIGTKDPKARLHVSAPSNPLYLQGLVLVGSADTILTISGGIVKKALKSAVNTSSSQYWSVVGNTTEADLTLGTLDPYGVKFITSGSQRIEITSGGIVGIASEGINLAESGYQFVVGGSSLSDGWETTSDRRLKKNIQNLNYGLKSVMALQPVSYNWNDPNKTTDIQLGLIAQDTKEIIPEVVKGDEDKGKLSINYTELIPVLINAIKEQQAKIQALELKLEQLSKQSSDK